ncbi:hypothetical protein CgunFtcFv8_014135 [Champsocephalus gunnari]|uniref:Uncharacterized protein n=1 Tax=Champsocephalus gunnari TaxID=52237 RepID=A0AAN8EFT9_CHAGU|nr:hypothetical protein CgunFtcFv8_014135 [Champsocephalus gunnari]
MVCQFLITFLFPPSLSEGKLGAAASFSTPVDPISVTTEGPGAGGVAAAETRPEGEQGRGGGRAARGEGSSSSRRRTEMDEQYSTGSIRHSQPSSNTLLLLQQHTLPP